MDRNRSAFRPDELTYLGNSIHVTDDIDGVVDSEVGDPFDEFDGEDRPEDEAEALVALGFKPDEDFE
jgi:hypothetical protein